MGREKKKQEYNEQLRALVKANGGDIAMGCILVIFAVGLGVIYFSAPDGLVADNRYYRMSLVFTLANTAVAVALLFKRFFFRWFTLTAISARLKGIEKNRIYPSQTYVTSLRVFSLMFCLVNLIFAILVIRKIN